MTLDEFRQTRPDYGVAIYAYGPGGPVTIEVHAPDGALASVQGATEEDAWIALLGAPAPPEPEPDTKEDSVFD